MNNIIKQYPKSIQPEIMRVINKFYSNVELGNYNSLNKKESEIIRGYHTKCLYSIIDHLQFPNKVIKSYQDIVIGDHGAYIEFEDADFNCVIEIKRGEQWRVGNPQAKYNWYVPSGIDDVKIYFQKNTVGYADYKIGKYYVSPFELFDLLDIE